MSLLLRGIVSKFHIFVDSNSWLHISDAFVSYCCSPENESCRLTIPLNIDDGRTPRFSSFTVFLTIKTSSQNVSITLPQISLKLHEHTGGYRRKRLPWSILKEEFPLLRNTAARKIGNGVILLLWQLGRVCNPDQNNFSFFTAVVVISPNLC